MFILGIIGFLQTTFIPGFIFLTLTGNYFIPKPKEHKPNLLNTLTYCFGLSLILNYLLVFLMTAVRIYTPLGLYIFLALETVLLWYAVRVYIINHNGKNSFHFDIKKWHASFRKFTTPNSLTYNALFLLSVVVILWYVFLFFYFISGVFEQWDPVVGWNRFAIKWAGNSFPTDTFRYPQLLPSNWSISYVLMQTTGVQCFAKSIMAFFPIGILFLFLDLAIKERKSSYLIGLIGYGVLVAFLYQPSYIVSGYADIAVSFFAFFAWYSLYKGHDWMAVIMACGASITKQGGMFFLVLILIAVFYHIIKKGEMHPFNSRFKSIAAVFFTFIIITALWYGMKEIQIRTGGEHSEYQLAQKANISTHYLERLENGVQKAASWLSPRLKYFFYGFLGLMVFGLFHRRSWLVTLCFSVPYFLVWGFLFSYDARNLAHVLPFMAFSTAYGLEFLGRFVPDPEKRHNIRFKYIPVIIAVIIAVVAANFTVFKQDKLVENQTEKRKKIGDKELNSKLYEYYELGKMSGKIMTTYQYLGFLPDLAEYYVYKPGRITPEFLDALDNDPKYSDIHYLLMPIVLHYETVYPLLKERIKIKKYRIIFEDKGYHFIKVRGF